MLKISETKFLKNDIPIPSERITLGDETAVTRTPTEIVERALCFALVYMAAEGCPIDSVQLEIQQFSLMDKLTPPEAMQCRHEIEDLKVEAENSSRLSASLALFGFMGLHNFALDEEIDFDEVGELLNTIFDYKSVSALVESSRQWPLERVIEELDYYVNYRQAYIEYVTPNEYGVFWQRIGSLDKASVENIAMALEWLVGNEKKDL